MGIPLIDSPSLGVYKLEFSVVKMPAVTFPRGLKKTRSGRGLAHRFLNSSGVHFLVHPDHIPLRSYLPFSSFSLTTLPQLSPHVLTPPFFIDAEPIAGLEPTKSSNSSVKGGKG